MIFSLVFFVSGLPGSSSTNAIVGILKSFSSLAGTGMSLIESMPSTEMFRRSSGIPSFSSTHLVAISSAGPSQRITSDEKKTSFKRSLNLDRSFSRSLSSMSSRSEPERTRVMPFHFRTRWMFSYDPTSTNDRSCVV